MFRDSRGSAAKGIGVSGVCALATRADEVVATAVD